MIVGTGDGPKVEHGRIKGPKVEHKRRQRLDLKSSEALLTCMVETSKDSCGGKKPQESKESTMQLINMHYIAHYRARFQMPGRVSAMSLRVE